MLGTMYCLCVCVFLFLCRRLCEGVAGCDVRSWSIFHWFAMPPAAALVVPRAENTTDGGGVIDDRLDVHLEMSDSIVAFNLGDSAAGDRREMV